MTQEITLSDADSLQVKTPQGVVWISTFTGTSIAVYDDPDSNPVSTTILRPNKEN